MRRWLEVAALTVTFLVLIATSKPPPPCAVETITVHVASTCGPEGDVELTSAPSCLVTLDGGDALGLPAIASLSQGPDAGFAEGSLSFDETVDGGWRECTASLRAGDGFQLRCAEHLELPDGGIVSTGTCDGTVTPR